MVSVKTLCLVLMFVLIAILEETEAEPPLKPPRGEALNRRFYCPDGTTFISRKEDVSWMYDLHCKCDCCPYNKRWECSDLPGSIRSFFEDDGFAQMNMKFACKVHDYCYATYGRSQKECDQEFKHNARNLCSSNFLRDFYTWGALSCSAVAEIAYGFVRAENQDMQSKWDKCPKDCRCDRTTKQQRIEALYRRCKKVNEGEITGPTADALRIICLQFNTMYWDVLE